jgi:hypothetical protein
MAGQAQLEGITMAIIDLAASAKHHGLTVVTQRQGFYCVGSSGD